MSWPEVFDPQQIPNLPELSPAHTLADSAWGAAYAEYYGIDFEKKFPGLRHYLGGFSSAGERIAGQVFALPQAQCTAWVCHGYYDHTGLFNHVIDYLLRRGCSVVAFDLPGHGLSTGERAAISDFLHYRQVLRDALVATRCFALPKRRLALAQSTGCAVLMSHLLDGGAGDFEKSVLMAPLIRPAGWQMGRHAHSLLRYFIRSLPRRFSDNSEDQAFLAFLRERDPLQPRTLPLSWITALKIWQRWFMRLPPAPACQVLVLQGDADETVDWRYNLPMIQRKFPAAQERIIPGARHHLAKEGERYREQLWAACDGFLFAAENDGDPA